MKFDFDYKLLITWVKTTRQQQLIATTDIYEDVITAQSKVNGDGGLFLRLVAL